MYVVQLHLPTLPYSYILVLHTTPLSSLLFADCVADPMRLGDIIPGDYDKVDSPKDGGQATDVSLRLTVLSLDTIDEISMVRLT